MPEHNDYYDLACLAFKDISSKNLDYPEALWDAWITLEYAHNSLASLKNAIAHIGRARTQVEARHMKYVLRCNSGPLICNARCHPQQFFQEAQKAAVSVAVPDSSGVPPENCSGVECLEIDPAASDARRKREADDDGPSEATDTKNPRLRRLPR